MTIQSPAQYPVNADFAKGAEDSRSGSGRILDWVRRNVEGDENRQTDYGTFVTAGLGIAGASTGGYLAHQSVANDEVIVKYDSTQVPKPECQDMTKFGSKLSRMDMRVFGEFIKANSGSLDANTDLKYLTYLAASHPGQNPVMWGEIYEGVKLHTTSTAEARQTIAVMAALLEKHPEAPPQQVYMEYLSRLNKTGDSGKALESFKTDFKVQPSDYNETIVQLRNEHTSPVWKLGKVGATVAGIFTGALVGVGLGVIANVVMKLISAPAQKP